MRLISSMFEHREKIPAQYTCDGNDMSPPLTISDVPDGVKSLVLIMDDPDAPAGIWDHWVVFNIPPDVTEIPESQEPRQTGGQAPGVSGKNSFGNLEYHGPCPPDREHRYFFKLYALDVELDLPEGASKAEVEQAMAGHIIEQAELMGLYERG